MCENFQNSQRDVRIPTEPGASWAFNTSSAPKLISGQTKDASHFLFLTNNFKKSKLEQETVPSLLMLQTWEFNTKSVSNCTIHILGEFVPVTFHLQHKNASPAYRAQTLQQQGKFLKVCDMDIYCYITRKILFLTKLFF